MSVSDVRRSEASLGISSQFITVPVSYLSPDGNLLTAGSVPAVGVRTSSLTTNNGTPAEDPSPTLEFPARYAEADGGHGWLVLLAAFLIYFINGGALSTHGIMLPYFSSGFQADRVIITMLPSVQFGLCLTSGLFAGPLVEIHGCRLVCVVGTILAGLGYVISAFTTNIWLFFVTYSIIPGIGLGFQYIPAAIIVQEWFDKKRSIATGIQSSGSGVGGILFPLITRALLDSYGWRGTLLMMGAIIFHVVPLAIIFATGPLNLMANKATKESQPPNHGSEKGSIVKDLVIAFRQLINGLFDFSVLKEVPCLVVLVGAFLFSIGYQIPYIFLPTKSILLGISLFHSALFISIFGISDVVGRLNAGWIGNTSCINRLQMFAFGMALSGVSMLTSAFFFKYELLILHAATFGCGVGVYQVMQAPCLVDLLGMDRLARAFGLLQVASGIAFLISPPMGAVMFKYTGNINLPFMVGGVSMILSGIFIFVYNWIAKPLDRLYEAVGEEDTAIVVTAPPGSILDSMGRLDALRDMDNDVLGPLSQPFYSTRALERGAFSARHLVASSRQLGSRRIFQSVRGLEGVRADGIPRDVDKKSLRSASRAYLPGAFGSAISIDSTKYFSSVIWGDEGLQSSRSLHQRPRNSNHKV